MSLPMPRLGILAALLLSCLLQAGAVEATVDPPPRELGQVAWQRDFDAALASSKADGRPLFVLFQEVPGCSTCVDFGDQVLSNPLLVEAIETEFRPVAILNNRGGADAAVLKRYGEPAWNNPVVRFLDRSGADLIARKSGVWSTHAIAERMIASLEAAQRTVPGYLRIAAAEARSKFPRRATFAMRCYWQGEACLGKQPGVVSSRAGWLEGREVVEIQYDGRLVSYRELVSAAREGNCANHVFAHGEEQREVASELFGEAVTLTRDFAAPASDSDQKYFLRRSTLAALELTPLQAARVNAALRRGEDPLQWLSPSQRATALGS